MADASLPVKARAVRQWRELRDALADLDRAVPCAVDPAAWHADDPAVREAAADACWDCPVLDRCAAYADAAMERYGVWGGTDRSIRNKPTARPIGRRTVNTPGVTP